MNQECWGCESTPSKSLLKRAKNRSKVWGHVSWFKKRTHSTENVRATACGTKDSGGSVSGQSIQGVLLASLLLYLIKVLSICVEAWS